MISDEDVIILGQVSMDNINDLLSSDQGQLGGTHPFSLSKKPRFSIYSLKFSIYSKYECSGVCLSIQNSWISIINMNAAAHVDLLKTV